MAFCLFCDAPLNDPWPFCSDECAESWEEEEAEWRASPRCGEGGWADWADPLTDDRLAGDYLADHYEQYYGDCPY